MKIKVEVKMKTEMVAKSRSSVSKNCKRILNINTNLSLYEKKLNISRACKKNPTSQIIINLYFINSHPFSMVGNFIFYI